MTDTATMPNRTVAAAAPAPLDPPERLLMGPGPSNPDPRVLAAMGLNPIGHLDPYFVETMNQTMEALRGVYRTRNHHTVPISATGSAGLETIMLNLLEPGDSAIVAVMGYFGHRLAEMARRSGADVRTVEVAPGEVVDPAAVDKLLAQRPA
jgi:alanine-glyoxylate transaminase/serine-glyoxylate transaminase/serine-pyruvate transaminase